MKVMRIAEFPTTGNPVLVFLDSYGPNVEQNFQLDNGRSTFSHPLIMKSNSKLRLATDLFLGH
jgi:hypothetical protein